jgi:hypothetical protein
MFTTATALARTMEAALLLAEVNLKVGEMTVAAGAVIGVRMGVIAAAHHDPFNADYVELGRMVPEKMRAFSEAGAAVVEEYWSLQGDVGNYMLHLGRTMMAGRLPFPSDLVELAERTSIHATRLATSGVGAAAVALAPLHKKATSNARRLARRNRRA